MKHSIFLAIFAVATGLHATCAEFNIVDFGAVGDGLTDDAAAIQATIDSCRAAGGGIVVIPAGRTFLCGPICLASSMELRLEPGSTLLASPDESAFSNSAFGENRGEGTTWISGRDLHDVSITGTGAIDGNGVAFMGAELDDSYELKPVGDFDPRPHVLTLYNVRRVVIRDVTICNSAYWTVHLAGCDDCLVSGVSILNNIKIRNGDGIDIDHSRRVRISDCHIVSGDDCICLKNRREFDTFGPCTDIVVANCTMTSRSCAVKIGSENVNAIKRVRISNCIISDSNRGIGIQNRDEGTVRDVVFSDITIESRLFSDVWWGKAEPIYVTSFPRAAVDNKDGNWRFPKGATRGECGEVSGIVFENITARSENGAFIGGETIGKVKNITLRNVEINLEKITDYPAGIYDKRPCDGEPFAYSAPAAVFVDTAGDILCENLRACLNGRRMSGAEAVAQSGAERISVQ